MIMRKSIEKVAIQNDNCDYFLASRKAALWALLQDNWKLVVLNMLGQADGIYLYHGKAYCWQLRVSVLHFRRLLIIRCLLNLWKQLGLTPNDQSHFASRHNGSVPSRMKTSYSLPVGVRRGDCKKGSIFPTRGFIDGTVIIRIKTTTAAIYWAPTKLSAV